eukprot:8312966-Pyramimonas_sp.AAC.1
MSLACASRGEGAACRWKVAHAAARAPAARSGPRMLHVSPMWDSDADALALVGRFLRERPPSTQ